MKAVALRFADIAVAGAWYAVYDDFPNLTSFLQFVEMAIYRCQTHGHPCFRKMRGNHVRRDIHIGKSGNVRQNGFALLGIIDIRSDHSNRLLISKLKIIFILPYLKVVFQVQIEKRFHF
jgi:hypothetical protein